MIYNVKCRIKRQTETVWNRFLQKTQNNFYIAAVVGLAEQGAAIIH